MGNTSGLLDKCMSVVRKICNRCEFIYLSVGQSRPKKKLYWAIALSLCFAIILILNILTPLIADDFTYLLIFGDFSHKINSFRDIIQSQINHYDIWGGRSVVHVIAQVLLQLPPLVTDLLNSAVYLAFVFLVYYHIKGRGKHDLTLFVLINLATWFLQPAYGDTILWITGSANYLWGTAIILLFLLPYRFYRGSVNTRVNCIVIAASLFFAGIIAGWTNENTAAALLIAILLFMLGYRSQGWKIPVWVVSGFVGVLIGFGIMILAPGNMARAGEAAVASPLVIAYRFVMYTLSFIRYLGAFNILFIILIPVYWHVAKCNRKVVTRLSLLYMLAVVGGIYSMLLSPTFPGRAWFGIITFNIIAFGIVFYRLGLTNLRFVNQMRIGLLAACLFAFCFSFYTAFKDIYEFHTIWQEREQAVIEAKAEGKTMCVFERYDAQSKFLHSENYDGNLFMYSYYGIDIQFKEKGE